MFFSFLLTVRSWFIVVWVACLIQVSFYRDHPLLQHLLLVHLFQLLIVDVVIHFALGLLG